MSSSIGKILKITIFGESHSQAIGLTIDGFPAGLKVDYEEIQKALNRRAPKEDFSTPRHENDEVVFLSGVFNDITTGSPITFIINNKDVKSDDYIKGEIRPSHADLSSYLKYDGFNDYRGGGATSGRLTVVLVVLGSLCRQILKEQGISLGTHILSLKDLYDREFDLNQIRNDIDSLKEGFPVLDKNKASEMLELMEKTKENKDSIGGVMESVLIGVPAGLGEPYFDSLESNISQLLFSIGGVKGVLFGDGLDFANKFGSEVNDELRYVDGNIKYLSNHNGGINGGISNGQPIIIKTIIKPVSSIGMVQKSINVETKENIDLKINGRHDSCILPRVKEVIDAVLAYAILDALMIYKARKLWLNTDLLDLTLQTLFQS